MIKRCMCRHIFYIFLMLTLWVRCGPKPSVSFNADLWRSDMNGCQKKRLNIYKNILEHRDELLGLNNQKIIKLLGRPERNELYKRNQKFFVYSITPTAKCDVSYQGHSLYLFVRFNAVGLSQEIFIQERPGFDD